MCGRHLVSYPQHLLLGQSTLCSWPSSLAALSLGTHQKNLPCVTTPRGLQGDHFPSSTSCAYLATERQCLDNTEIQSQSTTRWMHKPALHDCVHCLGWACCGRENHPRRTPSQRSRRDKAFRLENTCGRFFNETLAGRSNP